MPCEEEIYCSDDRVIPNELGYRTDNIIIRPDGLVFRPDDIM